MEPFGKLSLQAFQHDGIEASVSVGIIIAAIIITAMLFYYNGWRGLWFKWLTSLDPKRIGRMYLIVSLLMLFKGVVDAIMMRAQLALSVGDSYGFLSSSHFQQIFSAHGTTMIFFVGMGVVFGLLNIIIPLQIGARDVAFPFLNALSFWLFCVGAILVNVSLMIGNFTGSGWLSYPPLSGLKYSPDVGVDYWIWSVQIAGIGSLMSGINFIVTILKMRAPGMTLMKMPMFTWSALNSMVLVIFAFPILTVTLAMLALDRTFGMHFFTSEAGGNPMLYVNLIWAWGHPEVYILMLPAFGIFSEVVSTFSEKSLFGYVSMVWALIAITFLSFIVWLHHFFTMGAGANVNAFFGIMTMLIAIPTGVKIFNWLFTMYRGRIHFRTPMLWFLAFIFVFSTGGMTGVLMSIPPADFQVHNSLFLIAHFHSMVIGGVLFGFFAGYSYWFPKLLGFKLNERIGVYAFWFWFIGFLVAFMPLYILGMMGATRRIDHYDNPGWQPFYLVVTLGVVLIIIGVILQNLQLIVSIVQRKTNRDFTGDPWNGRTLEWSIPSPPAFYNFAVIPEVHERDAFWQMKQSGNYPAEHQEIHEIHMPKSTAIGMYMGVGALFFGFAFIWHIWWLVIVSFLAILICAIIRLTDDHTDTFIPVEKIKKIEFSKRNRPA
ncbi:MAG: cytochrome o ubiquinol oxidase subunit I [Parachlamydiales bacterium]|jgi:cytochrome o ubiquinol oxidase subunit 1